MEWRQCSASTPWCHWHPLLHAYTVTFHSVHQSKSKSKSTNRNQYLPIRIRMHQSESNDQNPPIKSANLIHQSKPSLTGSHGMVFAVDDVSMEGILGACLVVVIAKHSKIIGLVLSEVTSSKISRAVHIRTIRWVTKTNLIYYCTTAIQSRVVIEYRAILTLTQH